MNKKLLFLPANNTGTGTAELINVFEPDGFTQYPYITRLLEFQGETLNIDYDIFFTVKIFSGMENVQVNMLVLRQCMSVLPLFVNLIWFCGIKPKHHLNPNLEPDIIFNEFGLTFLQNDLNKIVDRSP